MYKTIVRLFILVILLSLFLSAQGMATDPNVLLSHPWEWVSFTNPGEEFEVEKPENYTLIFNNDHTVAIRADCNSAFGSYKVDGSTLTIAVGPMTMAACVPESRSDQFVSLLGGAAIYSIVDRRLHIDLIADGGTMVFTASAGESPIEWKTEGIVESYGDFYVGKFNQNTYLSFLHKEIWTTDMLQVALKIPGTGLNECKSVIIEIVKPSVEDSDTSLVLLTLDGLMDDSVRAKKFKLLMKKREEGWWEVHHAEQAQSCWPHRGHQEYSSKECQ